MKATPIHTFACLTALLLLIPLYSAHSKEYGFLVNSGLENRFFNNLENAHQALLDRGVPAGNITYLYGGEEKTRQSTRVTGPANPKQISHQFQQYSSTLRPGDTLYFVVSGHYGNEIQNPDGTRTLEISKLLKSIPKGVTVKLISHGCYVGDDLISEIRNPNHCIAWSTDNGNNRDTTPWMKTALPVLGEKGTALIDLWDRDLSRRIGGGTVNYAGTTLDSRIDDLLRLQKERNTPTETSPELVQLRQVTLTLIEAMDRQRYRLQRGKSRSKSEWEQTKALILELRTLSQIKRPWSLAQQQKMTSLIEQSETLAKELGSSKPHLHCLWCNGSEPVTNVGKSPNNTIWGAWGKPYHREPIELRNVISNASFNDLEGIIGAANCLMN